MCYSLLYRTSTYMVVGFGRGACCLPGLVLRSELLYFLAFVGFNERVCSSHENALPVDIHHNQCSCRPRVLKRYRVQAPRSQSHGTAEGLQCFAAAQQKMMQHFVIG